MIENPPPILDGAKVLAFATVDHSVVRVRDDLLYVNGSRVSLAAKLALCRYPEESECILLFCDDDWNSLGVSAHPSLELAQRRAEQEYHGIMHRWQPFHHIDEAAIDRQCLEPLCSFCGTSFRRVERMIEGTNAHICETCVRSLVSLLDGDR